jgi:hypothetical protein
MRLWFVQEIMPAKQVHIIVPVHGHRGTMFLGFTDNTLFDYAGPPSRKKKIYNCLNTQSSPKAKPTRMHKKHF